MPRAFRCALLLAIGLVLAPASTPTGSAHALICAGSYDVTALADGRALRS